MQRVVVNDWSTDQATGVSVATILHHDSAPEGLDFERLRFSKKATHLPATDHGALLSVVGGTLRVQSKVAADLHMSLGTHLYLPPGAGAQLHGQAATEVIMIRCPADKRARGATLLLRDDQFLAACALPNRALRWILTPQYLSRRVFLHHDKTLTSLSGHPVSWFHTTMFDVDGLPHNEEGLPAFKMSYNYRTEPNVCYQTEGQGLVRMAEHPYQDREQRWGPWQTIDSESTYHLSEDPTLAEWVIEEGVRRPRRNKHEIRITDGYVSLLCMHDPACTGAERHAAGEYSEYGDLAAALGSPEHKELAALFPAFDAMVDILSMAKARGTEDLESLPEHAIYLEGLQAQRSIEKQLRERMEREKRGRERILRPWMLAD